MPAADPTRVTPTRLRLRVAPGARRSRIVGRLGNAWKVRVHAAPERGKANEEVVDLIARTLGVKRTELRIVAGQTTRDKVVELAGMPLPEAERHLTAAVDEGDRA